MFMTVLIVDDSRIMRANVKSHFEEMRIPCDYVEAANGMLALAQMKEQKIDLILLDWNMPQMSGFEFLKKVREMPECKTLPIIMVTSESSKYNVIEALKAGATDYIIKPIDGVIFKEKLRKLNLGARTQ
jgi:two-component system chemotaxis response regulator CheY